MQQTEVFPLPSGKSVTLRRPGYLGVARATATSSDMLASVVLVVECVVEPKLWADVRPDIERSSRPWHKPEECQDLDDVLDFTDFMAIAGKLWQWVKEARDAAGPLSKTATD